MKNSELLLVSDFADADDAFISAEAAALRFDTLTALRNLTNTNGDESADQNANATTSVQTLLQGVNELLLSRRLVPVDRRDTVPPPPQSSSSSSPSPFAPVVAANETAAARLTLATIGNATAMCRRVIPQRILDESPPDDADRK
jgi:hypothetical protein